jgi:hypothetical protein
MEQRVSREPVASFVPGALLHYDLPELAARIRPRPAAILETADARRIVQAFGL